MRIKHRDFMELQAWLIRQHALATGQRLQSAAEDWIHQNAKRVREAFMVF